MSSGTSSSDAPTSPGSGTGSSATSSATSSAKKAAPAFGAERLLIVGTGALAVMHLPFWMNWLQANYPELDVQITLTRSAERFVSREGLSAIGGRRVIADSWPTEPETEALHVRLAEWPEAVAVYPASMDFVSRLATGAANTPVLSALQCTRAPIVVAPSLPPRAEHNPSLRENLRRLGERPGMAVAPGQAGRSSTTGGETLTAPPLWEVIRLLERERQALTDPPGSGTDADGTGADAADGTSTAGERPAAVSAVA